MLGVTSVVHAERPDSTAGTSNAGTRKLVIDPSSTSVALRAKASLIVSPLTHRDGNYLGEYQLKVRPYFFKSEKGSLLLAASDDAVRKLQAGTAINFTGQAVTHKDGRTHIVLGRATPSSGDRGSVTFSIITDDGKMSSTPPITSKSSGSGTSRAPKRVTSLTLQNKAVAGHIA